MQVRLYLTAAVVGLAIALGTLSGFDINIDGSAQSTPSSNKSLGKPHDPQWHADASTWDGAKRLLNENIIKGQTTKVCTEDATLYPVLQTAAERWNSALDQTFTPLTVLTNGSDAPPASCKQGAGFDVLLR